MLIPSPAVEQAMRRSDIFDEQASLWKGWDSTALFSALLQLGPPQKTWDPSTVSWGLEDQSCLYLSTDENTGSIVEFRFRFDLRTTSCQLLKDLLQIVREEQLTVIGEAGDIIRPELRDFLQQASGSSAARFVADPAGYLEKL